MNVLVWIVVVFAAFGAMFFGIAVTAVLDPITVGGLAAFLLVMGAGCGWQWRRDPEEAAPIVGFFTAITAIACGAYVWNASGPHPIALAVTIVSVLLFALCVWTLIATHFGNDTAPDILRARGLSPIWESAAVQFAFERIEPPYEGSTAWIELLLQNCGSGERRVVLGLVPDKKGLVTGPPANLTLGGSDVVRVKVPLGAPAGTAGVHRVCVHLDVDGAVGERTRRRHGTRYEKPVPVALTIAALFAGHIYGGGGLYFDLVVIAAPGGVGLMPPLPAPHTEVVWNVMHGGVAAS